jgi:hypothetical protein
MAGSGTGRKENGFEGSTYMRQVGGSMRVNCLVYAGERARRAEVEV